MKNSSATLILILIFLGAVFFAGKKIFNFFQPKNSSCTDCPEKCSKCSETDCALRELKEKIDAKKRQK